MEGVCNATFRSGGKYALEVEEILRPSLDIRALQFSGKRQPLVFSSGTHSTQRLRNRMTDG